MNADDISHGRNPFPGLRPFREDEEHLFFGRETQVDAMVNKLAATHFLVVVGTSGSGKSSLVNCGLRPALHRGWMSKAGTAWRVAQFRPGAQPIRALAEALASEGVLYSNFKTQSFGLASIIESELRTSKLGLVKSFEQARMGPDVNLLVVVDQFEELIRYHASDPAARGLGPEINEEAKAFVNLLLEVRDHPSLPICVVLTIRSDFLGDCAQWMGLPEAINESQYLVPRMSRDERRMAIVGPAAVGGASIDAALVTRLVNDVGENPDQLSILQHALNRTWAFWKREGSPGQPLALKHYRLAGTMDCALDLHAERAYAELGAGPPQQICALIMKALTDWGTDARGTRRPMTLGALCEVSGASESEIAAVINVFRKPSRSFLMPPGEEALKPQTPIDISHESLMRVWKRLKKWGEEEARSGQTYRRLLDWAGRWDKGEAELWRGPDLSSASAWRRSVAPTAAWAERYGSREDFLRATKFLDASEKAQRDWAAAEEAARLAQLLRIRRWAWGFGLSTFALLLGLGGYLYAYQWENHRYFDSIGTIWGVPDGIDVLSANQVSRRFESYRITRKGRFGPVVHMEIVDGAGRLKAGGALTGFEAKTGESFKREARWEYVYGADGRVAYEVALDRHGQRVRSIVYSPVDDKSPNSRNVYMIGSLGSPITLAESCAAFLRNEYTEAGHVAKIHYLDQIGNPTAGRDGASILQRSFDAKGRQTSMLSLWKDRRPMNDMYGNAELRISYKNDGSKVSETFDAAGDPIDVGKNEAANWHRRVASFDSNRNTVDVAYWTAKGKPGRSPFTGCHRLHFDYGENGSLIRTTCLDSQGEPMRVADAAFVRWEASYDDLGRETSWRYFDESGKPAKGWGGRFIERVAYDSEDNVVGISEHDEDGKPALGNAGYHKRLSTFKGGREVRTEYLGIENEPVAIGEGHATIERQYDTRGNVEWLNYLGVDGLPTPGKDGVASSQSRYDACGRQIEVRYLDERKKFAKGVRKAYDEDNNVIEETHLSEAGLPLSTKDMYARVVREFDRHRNVVRERYFDAQGLPWLEKGIYAEVRRRYDDHNERVDLAYFDAAGKPALGALNENAARVTHSVSPQGQKVSNYFDANNSMIKSIYLNAERLDTRTSAFSESRYVGIDGQTVPKSETIYYGPTGKRARVERESARLIKKYDEQGNLTEEAHFGGDGKPAPLSEQIYFDADERVVRSIRKPSKRTRKYDEHKGVVEEAFFGADGEPTLDEEGWARRVTVNDANGQAIERAYFGIHGEPVVSSSTHFHHATRVLDAHGNILELSTFDVDGKPLAIPFKSDGRTRLCARYTGRYDDNNKFVDLTCFDSAGRIVR
ncbi:ATP-binding protein [Variovorax sp. J22R115]|uniref:ATP-binding protein n=1 Tax=Variovorax sp. J22R115 TaxID=3053509 RepID=UPI002576139D|nr:ATP-binding protein [Variovorax sp. J22R115]MDM0048616.1 ATP-binding protein [Variovorax sp. J22R115]